MIGSRYRVLGAALLLAMAAAGAGFGAKYNKVLDIGKKGPAWKDLVGTDDKLHSLDAHEKAKAVVVVFTCNHCPVAVAYEDRLVAFANAYKKKGVDVVAINVNNMPADRLDKMKERAAAKKFLFPYLYDPTQKIARDYGARVTPHWYVLDQKRAVAYMGAFDDNARADKVTRKYVPDAVDAILAGRKPEVEETRPIGCGIRFEAARK